MLNAVHTDDCFPAFPAPDIALLRPRVRSRHSFVPNCPSTAAHQCTDPPQADIALPSPTVYCTAKVSTHTDAAAAQALAKSVAQQVAAQIWELRERFLPPTPQPPEVCRSALAKARLSVGKQPVVS